jgi:hypothetical protein
MNMTPKQYKDAIAKIGLSQQRAGVFMGRSPRQGQRWAAGDPIPESVAKLLRLMVRLELKPEDVS